MHSASQATRYITHDGLFRNFTTRRVDITQQYPSRQVPAGSPHLSADRLGKMPCARNLARALCAIDPRTSENLNVFAWNVGLATFASVPPSSELVSVMAELPEFTRVESIVREPYRRFVRWEVRSRRDPLDELDEHVEDVLVQVRHRHADLARAAECGGEFVLVVRCTPPTDVSPGLLLDSRHVNEPGAIRASVSVEVTDT